MTRILAPFLVLLSLILPAAASAAEDGEQVVLGLSQNRVSITATFTGTELLIFGAVKRDQPAPEDPLNVIVTVAGPSEPISVMRKERRAGIWVNTDGIRIRQAPSFYAVASSKPLNQILTATEDLRYRVSIPHVLRSIISEAGISDQGAFVDALIRIQEKNGKYIVEPNAVTLSQQTLFSTRVLLPSDLTEGVYKIRVYLTRDGKIVGSYDTGLNVAKVGMEAWLYNLAQQNAVIYALLAIVIAVVSGWAASEIFRLIRNQ